MFFLSCWRRLRRWEEQDIWLKAWRTLLGHPDEQGQLDRAEIFADGSFAPAPKKGACVGPTKRGKGTKWMVVADGQGLPLGNYLVFSSNYKEFQSGEHVIYGVECSRSVHKYNKDILFHPYKNNYKYCNHNFQQYHHI